MKPQARPAAPDEIPLIHALEAAENQERKETEDLLAAFDRSGRGPKRPVPVGGSGFIEYYAKKNRGEEGSARSDGQRARGNDKASSGDSGGSADPQPVTQLGPRNVNRRATMRAAP